VVIRNIHQPARRPSTQHSAPAWTWQTAGGRCSICVWDELVLNNGRPARKRYRPRKHVRPTYRPAHWCSTSSLYRPTMPFRPVSFYASHIWRICWVSIIQCSHLLSQVMP
jgi:hypothetical protein